MKTALVRILTIATLAASLSAFAADESKHNDAATASANSQQEGCAAYAHKEKKQKNAKPQRQNDDERTEQEKEFDRVLMGYYGG
jgi:type IV secretory pathway VirB6-like protein